MGAFGGGWPGGNKLGFGLARIGPPNGDFLPSGSPRINFSAIQPLRIRFRLLNGGLWPLAGAGAASALALALLLLLFVFCILIRPLETL